LKWIENLGIDGHDSVDMVQLVRWDWVVRWSWASQPV